MNWSGITNMLLRLAQAMVGHLPGGLGHVNVVTSMIFAGISGSSNADAAGEGSIIIPAMRKAGYDINYTVAVTACSAVMGVIIPPSIIMVVWGGVMNVSVSGLFLAGIVPGILIGFFQMGLTYYYAVTRHYPKASEFSLRQLGRAARTFTGAGGAPTVPFRIRRGPGLVDNVVFQAMIGDEANAIAYDGQGNIYVAGSVKFFHWFDMDSTGNTTMIDHDVAVAKYSVLGDPGSVLAPRCPRRSRRGSSSRGTSAAAGRRSVRARATTQT